MKRTKLALTSIVIPMVFYSPPTYAQEQIVYGQKFEPYSEARRTQAFEDLRKMRTDRARRLYGTKNGMLACELQEQMDEPRALRPAPPKIEAINDWLAVYPKIPSGSQRFLATGALSIACGIGSERARRLANPHSGFGCQPDPDPSKSLADEAKAIEMRNKIISCVLTAALSNNWFPSPNLIGLLKSLLRDATLDQKLREQASAVLAQKPLEMDTQFDSTLDTTEKMIKSASALARTEQRKVDWEHHQLSWWPKFIASITGPNGRMKEQVGTPVKEIRISIFPADESTKLADSLTLLADLYAKLPDSSKEIFTGRVLGVIGQLQFSNLHPAADTLLWEVFDMLDPTWLEQNEIESKLQSPYYAQSYDLAKAVKLELKVMEIQDLHYGGIPSNDNLRWVVGDLYDEMGDLKRSTEQYEIARQIDERLVRTSILKANESMDRDYDIRLGRYVSPYTVENPRK